MADGKALVKRIQNGEEGAFEILVEQYKRLVFNVIFRMVQNEADREDICQDVFVKVYRYIDSFNFDSKLSTWIARIAVNTTINHLKKKKVPLFDDCSMEDDTIENAVREQKSPDVDTEDSDLSSRLKAEIAKLPHQFRTIITLYHLQEMSYAEIGEVLNLPEGTVKSYLFRARKRLKERLLDKYQAEELWRANA